MKISNRHSKISNQIIKCKHELPLVLLYPGRSGEIDKEITYLFVTQHSNVE